jgi:cleavage and polyadenylation specificity factor subunit 1
LNIYELVKVPKYPAFPTNREQALPIQLFKHATYNLPEAPHQPSVSIASAAPGRKSVLRHLQPFSYKTRGVDESFTHYDGVFLLGDHPLWILGSEFGGIRIHKCQYNNVYAFTFTTMWNGPTESQPNFLMHTDSGPILTEWIEDYSTEGALPTRSMKQGKAYSHIRYNSSLNLLLAAAAHPSKYKLFDEEGNAMWEPEGGSNSHNYRSSILKRLST